MKLKKLLAMVLALTMVMTITACTNNTTPSNQVTTAPESDDIPEGGDTPEGENPEGSDNGEIELPESDEFDFGLVKFSSRGFEIEMGGSDIKIGGNMGPSALGEGGGASGAIRIIGFQGYPKPADGYPDYNDGSIEDPDGELTLLVSANGPVWENIARIEASFFFTGEGEPEDIGNVEVFMQDGGLSGFSWWNSGQNLIEQFSEEHGGDGFKWGDVMTAIWDVTEFKNNEGIAIGRRWTEDENGEWYLEYVFDRGPELEDPDDPDGDEQGGGVSKFGLMVQNDNIIEDIFGTIHWTDVVIYVYDMQLWEEHVAMVYEETGVEPSQNTQGRVFEIVVNDEDDD
jgi:hypothetical protein